MSSPAQHGNFMPPDVVRIWQKRALAVGILFAIPSIIGWVMEYDQFYRSYLLGYLLCLEVTLGSLGLLMLYHISGGAWGTVIRRILEAGMSNIWLIILLFVPVAIGVHRLYPWSRPDEALKNVHMQRITAQYLNLHFWLLRAALYFIAAAALVIVLNRVSKRQDREYFIPDRGLRAISGPGLVVYLFLTLFMYVDWLMSLQPEWVSFVYPLIFNAAHGLATISFAVIIAALLVRREPMRGIIKPDQFLDHGKIMLTFILVWAWWTYGQWIIFWSGNIPSEISWFLARTRGGWRPFAFVWIIAHFFIPFALLLSRSRKSNSERLMKVAAWCLLARYIDLFWNIVPSFSSGNPHFHYSWLDAVVPISLAGFWVSLFFYHLSKRPLLAVHDDHVKIILEEGHEFEHERA